MRCPCGWCAVLHMKTSCLSPGRNIMLCSWVKYVTWTVLLSTQENLEKCVGWDGEGEGGVSCYALKSLMGQLNLGHFRPRRCHQKIPVIAICQPFSSIFLESHVFQILHYLSIVAVCQEVVPFCRCQKTVRVWRKSGRNIFNSWEMFQRRWRPPLQTFTHLHRVSSRYCILLFYLFFLWLFFVNAVISPTSSVFAL